jgi:hypothetical protein
MTKFRKKPVVIEAWQWNGLPDLGVVPDWLSEALYLPDFPLKENQVSRAGDKLKIGTLEGVMEASAGDWIIKGVKGELYPCKPDIFAATYDSVE